MLARDSLQILVAGAQPVKIGPQLIVMRYLPSHSQIAGTSTENQESEAQQRAEKISQRFIADLYPFDPPMNRMGELKNEVLLIH